MVPCTLETEREGLGSVIDANTLSLAVPTSGGTYAPGGAGRRRWFGAVGDNVTDAAGGCAPGGFSGGTGGDGGVGGSGMLKIAYVA